MPTFEVTSPEGKTFEINAPEGATQEQALDYAKQHFSNPAAAPSSGPMPVNAGLANLSATMMGLPMETVKNVANLGIAGFGAAKGLLGGTPPDLIQSLPGDIGNARGLLNRAATDTGIRGLSPDNPQPGNKVGTLAYDLVSKGAGIPGMTVPAIGAQVGESIAGTPGAIVGSMVPGSVSQFAREATAAGRNALASKVNAAFDTPYAKQGAENAQTTGMNLTPGQETGNASILLAENAARQSFFTRNKVLKNDQQVAMQAIDHVNNLADNISANKYSSGAMGETLQTALNDAVKKVDSLRDRAANLDYGEVRSLGGDKPIITYSNTAAELKKIIDEYKNVAGADAEKITAQSQRMLSRLTKPQDLPTNAAEYQAYIRGGPQSVPKTVTVDEAMRTRRYYSQASAGTGNVFDEIASNLNRNLAARLAKASDADFQAAQQGSGPVYQALQKANQNYADHTKSIEYVQSSVLGKLLGKDVADAALTGAKGNTISGEVVAQKMLNMHPSEASTVSNILSQSAPHILVDAKAYIIRDALGKGMDIPASAGANTIPLSYAKFVKALPKEEYLKAMRFSPKELMDVKATIDAMERAGDRTGYNQSQTAVISSFYNDLKGLAGLSVKGAVSVGGQALGLNKIADAMASPQGRLALRQIVTPGLPPDQLQKALATIGVANQ